MADRSGKPIVVDAADGPLPLSLWLPASAAPAPVVLAGHGLAQSRRSLYPASLPRDITTRGLALAAIDAPEHGDRAGDPAFDAVAAAWRAHWRASGATRVANDYAAVLDALALLPEVDARRVGYFGLSLGTQYGLGLLAMEPRIVAAVLGLFGLPEPAPRIEAYAARVTCPVFFILQEGDEIHRAERVEALYDRIASREKRLVRSPGVHAGVPPGVAAGAADFLTEQLLGKREGA